MEINLTDMFDNASACADAFLDLYPRWDVGEFNINLDNFSINSITFDHKEDETIYSRTDYIGLFYDMFDIDEIIKRFKDWVYKRIKMKNDGIKESDFIKGTDFTLTIDLYQGIWIEPFQYVTSKDVIISSNISKLIVKSDNIEELINKFRDWLIFIWERYKKDRKRKGQRKIKHSYYKRDYMKLSRISKKWLNETLEYINLLFLRMEN